MALSHGIAGITRPDFAMNFTSAVYFPADTSNSQKGFQVSQFTREYTTRRWVLRGRVDACSPGGIRSRILSSDEDRQTAVQAAHQLVAISVLWHDCLNQRSDHASYRANNP
jgi:hypothetical protein